MEQVGGGGGGGGLGVWGIDVHCVLLANTWQPITLIAATYKDRRRVSVTSLMDSVVITQNLPGCNAHNGALHRRRTKFSRLLLKTCVAVLQSGGLSPVFFFFFFFSGL